MRSANRSLETPALLVRSLNFLTSFHDVIIVSCRSGMLIWWPTSILNAVFENILRIA